MLLSYKQLAALSRDLRATPVLSVYIAGAAADPARRLSWRQELRNGLDEARATATGQSKSVRDAFDMCERFLNAALDEIPSAIGAPGWVAFVSTRGLEQHGPVPAPMPNIVKWQVGAWVSPYVRVLKQTHPVIVAVADSRSAVLYRYHGGDLRRLEKLQAHGHGGHADHMGDAPREHFHGGTRGETATDAAEHTRLAGRDRMLREVSDRIEALLKDDGAVVIGGAPETARALKRALPDALAPRILVSGDLPMNASEAEVMSAAERDAKILRNARDTAAVEQVMNLAASHGRGVTGAKQTLAVLSSGEGERLLITLKYLAEHAGEAEAAVEFALDHDADVELVTGEAGALLDAQAGGVAALLRFVRASSSERDMVLATR